MERPIILAAIALGLIACGGPRSASIDAPVSTPERSEAVEGATEMAPSREQEAIAREEQLIEGAPTVPTGHFAGAVRYESAIEDLTLVGSSVLPGKPMRISVSIRYDGVDDRHVTLRTRFRDASGALLGDDTPRRHVVLAAGDRHDYSVQAVDPMAARAQVIAEPYGR